VLCCFFCDLEDGTTGLLIIYTSVILKEIWWTLGKPVGKYSDVFQSPGSIVIFRGAKQSKTSAHSCHINKKLPTSKICHELGILLYLSPKKAHQNWWTKWHVPFVQRWLILACFFFSSFWAKIIEIFSSKWKNSQATFPLSIVQVVLVQPRLEKVCGVPWLLSYRCFSDEIRWSLIHIPSPNIV